MTMAPDSYAPDVPYDPEDQIIELKMRVDIQKETIEFLEGELERVVAERDNYRDIILEAMKTEMRYDGYVVSDTRPDATPVDVRIEVDDGTDHE